MRQQVNATIRLTLDADASLDAGDYRTAITAALLRGLPEGSPVEVAIIEPITIQEEAEIYGNA